VVVVILTALLVVELVDIDLIGLVKTPVVALVLKAH
jgi:hypothetical protein